MGSGQSPPREGETTTEETTGTAEESKAKEELEGTVRDYHEAVDARDFGYTYRNLTSASRALFSSEEEWVKKNRLIAESERLKLSSMEVDLPGEIPSGSEAAAGARARVVLDRTFADGSTISRETVFVREEDGGAWRHELSAEEIAIFEPGIPLNEFAGEEEPPKEEPAEETTTSSEQEESTTEPSARTPESTSSGTSEKAAGASEERAVEAAVRDHYAAIGRRDFRTAYSYFGPSFRSSTDERRWVAEEESYRIRDAKVNSVRVGDVSASEATAAVDVSFEDKTGSPRFSISCELVKEGGKWKLDEQSSAAR